METERIEYLRKNGRKKGKKKGVLWCGIDDSDPDSVMIGFTLCNSIDRFDYIEGKPVPGFGAEIAKKRADKWKNHTEYFVQKSYTQSQLYFDDDVDILMYKNPNPQEVVEVPPSIVDRLKTFIERCKRYYKDKDFPQWCENVIQNKAIDKNLLETEDFC
jgi:hypothetical protein